MGGPTHEKERGLGWRRELLDSFLTITIIVIVGVIIKPTAS